MRVFLGLILLGSVALGQNWRTDLMGLPDHPTAANAQDIDRFVQNVQLATPYFASITPGDFEANREMVRRMWAYTMALEAMSKQNPALRGAAGRARRAMNGFPIGYMMLQPQAGFGGAQQQSQPPPPTPAKPGDPPFAMKAPAGAPQELSSRYDSTAARAASAWQNADKMRRDLASRGMSLNAATASALARLEGDMESAARSIQSKNLEEANASLDRADAEIEKISKVVGH